MVVLLHAGLPFYWLRSAFVRVCSLETRAARAIFVLMWQKLVRKLATTSLKEPVTSTARAILELMRQRFVENSAQIRVTIGVRTA